MLWEVDLSNGKTIQENKHDLGHWGKFIKDCRSKNLEIIQFRLVDNNGESKIIDKNADRYYIINEIIAFIGGQSISRRGVCSVREAPEKIRIEWYQLEDGKFITTEIISGVDDHISEISVARYKS